MSELPDDATLDKWAAGIIDLSGEEARAVVDELRRLRMTNHEAPRPEQRAEGRDDRKGST